MRRFVAALAATAAVAASLAFAAEPASAASANRTPGCVTKAEFRAVHRGDSLADVRRITGQSGRVSSSSTYGDGDGWKSIDFRQCGKSWYWSSIDFDFEKTEKEQYVSDVECDYDGDCYDYGDWETVYTEPYVVTSKYAYWR